MAAEIPHELFALWAYPASGGVLLLGPEAMAESRLVLPEPTPHLTQDQLFELEQVLRRAQYASAIAMPIRESVRDVGVLLIGAFAPGQFGRTPGRLHGNGDCPTSPFLASQPKRRQSHQASQSLPFGIEPFAEVRCSVDMKTRQ